MSRPNTSRSSASRAVTLALESLESRPMLSTLLTSWHALAPAAEVSGHQHHRRGPGQSHGHDQGPRGGTAMVGDHHAAQAHPGVKILAAPASAPYTPALIRHAYGFDQLAQDGTGQTIAIVDAFDDPTIAADVAKFSLQFGLPPATLVKAVPATGTPAFDAGWAGEIALDVEWAHAIAPKATILLVEAASATYDDLLAAVDYAVAHGANQVSMSWIGDEFAGQSSLDSHFNHPGVTFVAASGDNGAGVGYPATSPYVTTVGGTTLKLDTNGNRISETAWSGSGGGPSTVAAKPSYQVLAPGSMRGAADVSYDADPNTGVLVYNSSAGGAWYAVGGTSAGAPQWAGLIALANQGRASAGKAPLGTGLTYGTNQVLYRLATYAKAPTWYSNPHGSYKDITAGSNGYQATTGYDYPTGLGSPVANRLYYDLLNS